MQLLSNYLSGPAKVREAEVYVNASGVYYTKFRELDYPESWKTYSDLDVAEEQAEDWVLGELNFY